MIDEIICGDAITTLQSMPSGSINCCITSPPYYGLRDYGIDGQIGQEPTPDVYVSGLVKVFREVWRVMKPDSTLWLNIGDSYAGSWGNAGGQNRGNGTQRSIISGSVVKNQLDRNGDFVPPGKYGFTSLGIKKKDLIGIPWMVAFALRSDGWFLRQDIIWHKSNPMPESVLDRCTKSHEYMFLLSKSKKYYFDNEAIKEPAVCAGQSSKRVDAGRKELLEDAIKFRTRPVGRTCGYPARRNRRSVWTISTKPYKEAHFAVFPEKLIEPCVLAGCPEGGIVLDPFIGSGTTGAVARRLGRHFIGIELKPEYCTLAESRIAKAEASL